MCPLPSSSSDLIGSTSAMIPADAAPALVSTADSPLSPPTSPRTRRDTSSPTSPPEVKVYEDNSSEEFNMCTQDHSEFPENSDAYDDFIEAFKQKRAKYLAGAQCMENIINDFPPEPKKQQLDEESPMELEKEKIEKDKENETKQDPSLEHDAQVYSILAIKKDPLGGVKLEERYKPCEIGNLDKKKIFFLPNDSEVYMLYKKEQAKEIYLSFVENPATTLIEWCLKHAQHL